MLENDNTMGCGSWSWIIIILFLFLMGGNGFGGSQPNELQRAVDLNSIQEGQANIMADVQRGIYEINGNTANFAYNNLGEIRDVQAAVASNGANIINTLSGMQTSMQNCCCTTQRAIDGVNYNLATQSAAIQANDTANTQKILDALAQNKIEALQQKIASLELANAVSGVVKYPMASTYNSGNNPFCGCGCNVI